MDDPLLTPQEVADILKIKKSTVYFMIKRGDFRAKKLGKQLRIFKSDVDSFIGGTAGKNKSPLPAFPFSTLMMPDSFTTADYPPYDCRKNPLSAFILSGQDEILDIVCNFVNQNPYGLQMLRAYMGSYTGLCAMYQEQISATTCHLWDAQTDTYNIPYVKRLLPGEEVHVFHLCNRRQGFYVAKGNPKNITGFNDLGRNDITYVNREKGSGTRVLLDSMLNVLHVAPARVPGYNHCVNTSLVAASTISKGGADFALGNERAALQIAKAVDFVPLKVESYDLVIRKRDVDLPIIQCLIGTIRSAGFQDEVGQIGCYDITDIGKQII